LDVGELRQGLSEKGRSVGSVFVFFVAVCQSDPSLQIFLLDLVRRGFGFVFSGVVDFDFSPVSCGGGGWMYFSLGHEGDRGIPPSCPDLQDATPSPSSDPALRPDSARISLAKGINFSTSSWRRVDKLSQSCHGALRMGTQTVSGNAQYYSRVEPRDLPVED
jgi:hypothetical protein